MTHLLIPFIHTQLSLPSTNSPLPLSLSFCFFVFPTRRILVVDTNFQSLVALSDAGVNRQSNPSPSLAQKYSVFWPHQIYCDGISSSSSSSTMMATVYLSEYLGRIWKMQLQVNWIQGTVEFRDTLAPSLVVDKSQFPASIYVRGQLNAARLRGLESFDVISFDADF